MVISPKSSNYGTYMHSAVRRGIVAALVFKIIDM